MLFRSVKARIFTIFLPEFLKEAAVIFVGFRKKNFLERLTKMSVKDAVIEV